MSDKMEAYLVDLIKRVNTKDEMGNGYDSSKSVSWNALREAEKLKGASYVPQLTDYIAEGKNKINRNSAYFILGKMLAKNTSPAAIQFYINRLPVETDRCILSGMLDRLAEIEKIQLIDIAPIIQCTYSEKWQIRHATIQALSSAEYKEAKGRIRDIVN